MAIVPMQKLSLCALKTHRKAILEELQRLGVMDIQNDLLPAEGLPISDTHTAIATFQKNAELLESALSLLKTYAPKKGGFQLFSEPEKVEKSAFEDVISRQQQIVRSAQETVSFDKSITSHRQKIRSLENQIIALEPWLSLDVPMNYHGTRTARLLLGTIPGKDLTEGDIVRLAASGLFAEESPEHRNPPVEAFVLSSSGSIQNIGVLCLRKHRDAVLENLRRSGFTRISDPDSDTPQNLKKRYEEQIQKEQDAIESLKEKLRSKAAEEADYKTAADYYRTRAEKYRLLGTIPQSKHAFFLQGYVTKDRADAVCALLRDRYGASVEKESLLPGEQEPTLLQNNRFSASAEGVLEAYGLPTHGRTDPTFVMSIFYVFFFGMMLSDAGYGLVMALGSLFAVKKYPAMKEGTKKMLNLFFWCGLSTTFWGFMYGGFFGDALDVIAKTFFGFTGETVLPPLWFAPLHDPMRLLVYCLLFGLIHLFAGLGIKGYEYLKNKDLVGFFCDTCAWYILLIGLVFLLLPSDIFVSISGMSFSFPSWVQTAATYGALLGMLTILVMSGRGKKNFGIRLALGAYDLYGITNWLSDLLSYSRLLALGLATGVIANVINLMASMKGNSVFGAIIFIVVFILGHTLNLGINALGAYVHTNRLQYVEFFGKFYDGGGKKFSPFKHANQYIQIKEEQ